MEQSILQMARGAIEERVDYEMSKVIENILDLNTKASAKRKITLTLEIVPDELRENVGIKVTAKSVLAPTNSIVTSLFLTYDENGESVAFENTPQIPGQQNFDGSEQEAPSKLKLVKPA